MASPASGGGGGMWQLLPGFAPACGLLMDAHSPRNTAAAICAGRGGGGGSSSGGSNGGSVGPLAAYIDGAARACSRWEAQRTASLRALTALVNAITTRANARDGGEWVAAPDFAAAQAASDAAVRTAVEAARTEVGGMVDVYTDIDAGLTSLCTALQDRVAVLPRDTSAAAVVEAVERAAVLADSVRCMYAAELAVKTAIATSLYPASLAPLPPPALPPHAVTGDDSASPPPPPRLPDPPPYLPLAREGNSDALSAALSAWAVEVYIEPEARDRALAGLRSLLSHIP